MRTHPDQALLLKACSKNCQSSSVCRAEDATTNHPPVFGRRKHKDSPDAVKFVIEMKVTVTRNIATDANIMNGMRGTFVDTILNPQEPQLGGTLCRAKIALHCALLKLNCACATCPNTLDGGIILILPPSPRCKSPCRKNQKRCQYLMTVAHRFIDYHSKDQTVPHIIVNDLRSRVYAEMRGSYPENASLRPRTTGKPHGSGTRTQSSMNETSVMNNIMEVGS